MYDTVVVPLSFARIHWFKQTRHRPSDSCFGLVMPSSAKDTAHLLYYWSLKNKINEFFAASLKQRDQRCSLEPRSNANEKVTKAVS